jgi:hypothetical protein
MKKHSLVATIETIRGFQDAYSRNGLFEASMPLHDPKTPWPEAGDALTIHSISGTVVMLAFVRTVSPGTKREGDKQPRLAITAGVKIRPFGSAVPAQSP